MSAAVDKAVADIVRTLEPRATREDIVRIAYLQGHIDGLQEARKGRTIVFPPQDDSLLDDLPP